LLGGEKSGSARYRKKRLKKEAKAKHDIGKEISDSWWL